MATHALITRRTLAATLAAVPAAAVAGPLVTDARHDDAELLELGRQWEEAVAASTAASDDPDMDEEEARQVGPITVLGDGPLVVRQKSHQAEPMTLDQALYEMELVGHDFFLFVDKESECPSVVYRRRGYDYGVITLDVQ